MVNYSANFGKRNYPRHTLSAHLIFQMHREICHLRSQAINTIMPDERTGTMTLPVYPAPSDDDKPESST